MSVFGLNGNQLQTAYNIEESVSPFCFGLDNSYTAFVQNYYMGQDLSSSVVTLSLLGTLKYNQAMCIYNGHYFTTDGENIAEQDENFQLIRDVPLHVGHGNGFQLGSNGLAYISGWNDQLIYVIDLNSLTLVDTITLPTTGYTTCVVDDVENIAYILQRDTRPNTNSKYNYIVYDYGNEEIILQRQTEFSFGALQAMDWFGENIIVLNGIGNGYNNLVNGIRIYDKLGNFLGEFVINQFGTEEPEGVCVDRNTHEIVISFRWTTVRAYKVNVDMNVLPFTAP